MSEEVGNLLYCAWVYPALTVRGATIAAGTFVLSTDFRQFTPIDDTQTLVDKSAGADEERTYIAILKDGKMAATVLDNGGTTYGIILASGNSGTLVSGPSGTADGKWKITRPAIIQTSKLSMGYDSLKIWDLTFQPSATGTYGTWASGA